MAANESVVVRESLPLGIHEHETQDVEQDISNIEQDASNVDQADSRQWVSNRERARVLVGCAISQLPIWGML